MRTDAEIVQQTNDLARLCLRFQGTGYEAPPNHKFYEADDYRSKAAWQHACEIQELMTATDPNDALSSLDETQTYRVEIAADVRAYGYVEVEAPSAEAAIALVTPELISAEFKLRGYGVEDIDATTPTSIYLSEILVADDPDSRETVEKDIPDNARVAGWTTIMLEDAIALTDAVANVSFTTRVQDVIDRLRAYVETSAP